MTLAERLLRVVLSGGFGRLKRIQRRGDIAFEIWIADGGKQSFEGDASADESEALDDVIAKAEAHLGKRAP